MTMPNKRRLSSNLLPSNSIGRTILHTFFVYPLSFFSPFQQTPHSLSTSVITLSVFFFFSQSNSNEHTLFPLVKYLCSKAPLSFCLHLSLSVSSLSLLQVFFSKIIYPVCPLQPVLSSFSFCLKSLSSLTKSLSFSL